MAILKDTGVSNAPLFTIIVADYEPSVPREIFRRKMECLASQTCKDFEVLVYHDGPKSSKYSDDVAGMEVHPATHFNITAKRANDWGHSNRDHGIRAATGEWIIHSNADNVFYPVLIDRLKKAIESKVSSLVRRQKPIVPRSLLKRVDKVFGTKTMGQKFYPATNHEILIYAVLMRGLVPAGFNYLRDRELAKTQALLFGGIPVVHGQIDLMQFVMRRDLWLKYGGWYDRHEESDGRMYERFAKIHAVTAIPEVLGEHW